MLSSSTDTTPKRFVCDTDSLEVADAYQFACLCVARTLAGLESVESITKFHIAEAIQYRSLHRQML